jgi:hypothetical protein
MLELESLGATNKGLLIMTEFLKNTSVLALTILREFIIYSKPKPLYLSSLF